MFKGGDVVSCYHTQSSNKRRNMVLNKLSNRQCSREAHFSRLQERASLSTRRHVQICVRIASFIPIQLHVLLI